MTAADIISLVARSRGLSESALRGRSRYAGVVFARHEAMWLLRHETMHSYPEIGKMLGNRDHTTVIDGVRRIEKMIQADMSYRTRMRSIVRPSPPDGVACSGCISHARVA